MDHVAAFDDIRRFNTINGEKVPCEPGDPLYRGLPYRIVGKPIVCHAMGETIEQMHRIFPYIGTEGGKNGLYRPMVKFSDAASFSVGSMVVVAVPNPAEFMMVLMTPCMTLRKAIINSRP